MRLRDLLFAGLYSLRRQKLRSALTTLGVTIGIATLVASVGVGIGVRRIIEDGFKKERRLREIVIYPGHERTGSDEFSGIPDDVLRVDGAMSDVRRERVRKRLAREWRRQHVRPAPKPLTMERLSAIEHWDHVVAVEPDLVEAARVVLNGQVTAGECAGVSSDSAGLANILEVGVAPAADGLEAIVHEFLLYRLGVRADADLHACLGQKLRLEFSGSGERRPELLLALFDADATRLTEQELRAMSRARELLPLAVAGLDLPEDEKAALLAALGRKRTKDPKEKTQTKVVAEFRIVGVFRDVDRKRDGDLLELLDMPGNADVMIARGPAEQLFAGLPQRAERGFNRATIIVDSEDNLKSVCDRLKAEGMQYHSIGRFLQLARRNVLLIGFTMDFVALLALSVACLGIMNTMFTAVLERTKEIGVMKAVGAKDRHILGMFLSEGAIVGLLGGWLGVLVAWLVSFPGDNVALRLIAEQEGNVPRPETVFRYPVWLVFGAPLFAMAMTTLAGLLPARRAARVEPVIALRAE